MPRSRLLNGLLALTLAACAAPPPLPTLVPTLAALEGTEAAATAPAVAEATPAEAATPADAEVTPRPPTPTAVPVTLVVCQQAEPSTLYLYADDVAARAGILEALYDGPLDTAGYGVQPVILEELPSAANGRLVLKEVTVRPDDRVVDAVDLQVKILSEGVRLAQLDGTIITATAGAPARTVQVSAEFRLKPGLTWSDNQRLTADDSRFSFEAAAYFDTPTSKFVTDRTQSYAVVDAAAVRWTGLPGWRDRDAARRFWSPLPRHLYEGVNPSELKNNLEANTRPIGWGPFAIREWRQGEQLTLVRNPYYHRAGDGLPRVDQVTFRFGLTAEQILAEIAAGRCDVGPAATDFSSLTPRLLEAQAAGQAAPYFITDLAFEHLDFGIRPADDYRRPAGAEVFQDARVRQAIAHCVDRRALIRDLLNGIGEPPAGYVPVDHPALGQGRLTTYAFDRGRGQALLAEAGWADADGDNVRERGDQRLTLEYVSGPEASVFRQQLAEALRGQLAACGIELRLKWVAPENLYEPWPNSPLFGRRFDLGGFPWRSGLEPPCELYLSDALPTAENPGGANNTGYSSPEFDQACLSGRRSFDPAASQAAHFQALAAFARDLPSLPLFFRYRVTVAHPGVTGYRPDPTTRSDLWNIEEIQAPNR